MKKQIGILGSTGSIGTQALEVIDKFPDYFGVEVLSTYNNVELLIKQAFKFVPSIVVVGNIEKYQFVKEALTNYPIEVMAGQEGLIQAVKLGSLDMVLSAMVGFSGLIPTINAIKAGKDIALANKETLVIAGELVINLAKENNVNIYPVDSEHSALFQCLVGEENNKIEKIYLTASGGPFRGKDEQFLKSVTREQALNHPNWCMGPKISIDSATLMNKGFEAIEAKWLFSLTPEQIDVVIHPQSIIHSIVQFEDGSMKAQMGLPDMRLPILYALGYSKRMKTDFKRLDFLQFSKLDFEMPDTKNFRNLALAYEVMKIGGNLPCVLNAANEVAVESFLCELIGFLDISAVIEKTLSKIDHIKNPKLDDFVYTDEKTRKLAKSLI